MATPNEQLRNTLQEIKAAFKANPYIQTIPADGDPPEKYEIRYNILGLARDEDGNIIETRNHIVFISIPFGFPHFPPSCSPRSVTFHPDFDQASICIGEFWTKDKTLTELIVHIGKMISGEVYSRENVFNDAALAWYRKIAGKLPFENIDLSLPPLENTVSPALSEELIQPPGIDILNNDDFTDSTDYLDDEWESDLEKQEERLTPSTLRSSGKSSVNRIQLLIRQKRYYELSIFLNELSETERPEDLIDIETNVESVLKNAQNLQREADEFEHRGDPQKALELFEKVAHLVPDFPNIEENIERTRNSVELSGDDWTTDEWAADDGTSDQPGSPDEPPPGKPKKRVAFFEETTKVTIKYLPLLGGIIVLALAMFFITPLITAKSHLEKSLHLYNDCAQLIDQGQFKKAQIECDEALSTLKKISIYKNDERDALQKQIKLTLASEDMIQGLSGRVLFEGKYVRKADMDRVSDFNALRKEGDALYDKSLWLNAVDKYRSALKNVKPIQENIEESYLRDISEKIRIAEIHITANKGSALMSRGELEKSHEMYASALSEAEALPEELGRDLVTMIEPKIHEIEYLQHLDLGEKFFNTDDWESAVKQYEKALQLRVNSSISDNRRDVDSLYANMAEAELFSYISGAKNAFSQAKLDQAIGKYQEAIRLLNSKKDLLQRINPDEIKQQLERIILRTRIVQYKQMADVHLQNERNSEAITTLEKVISAVNLNNLQDDMEFKTIIEGTRQTITETRDKATTARRIAYLKDNYKEIFETNYSAAIPEYLSDPKVTFLRNIEGKELYELQCLESNRGRKLRLLMLYLYDPILKTWQFYSESN